MPFLRLTVPPALAVGLLLGAVPLSLARSGGNSPAEAAALATV
jgi:hypothetical protein